MNEPTDVTHRAPRSLMIAFQYPPMTGSSALARITRFVRYMPHYGWDPVVLTASENCYESTTSTVVSDNDTVVYRAWAVDAKKAFGLRGRVPRRLALPDRWSSWWVSGVAAGLVLCRRQRPSVIWSSYPIATAHSIAATLQRLTGLPWVADFRDPIIDGDYPNDRLVRARFEALERRVVERASAAVFTTPGALADFARRYPGIDDRVHLICIPNGYDEADFANAGDDFPVRPGKPITLLHSGAIYPNERDPSALFAALRRLKVEGEVNSQNFQLLLRATGHDELIKRFIAESDLTDLVDVAPPITQKSAIEEMRRADGLLILQAANCNRQVPAKLYEYLRCGRPILGLTDRDGDTAALLREVGITTTLAPLDDPDSIQSVLSRLLADIRKGVAYVPDRVSVSRYSRESQAGDLAALFDSITGRTPR